MKMPERENSKYKYCKLYKALYGLKQAGRMWNEMLNKVLLNLNFCRLISDPCLYVKINKNDKIICLVGVYVDDIIITGIDSEINETKKLLKQNFEVTDIGNVNFIIEIKFEKLKNRYLIHQRKYLKDILEKFGINKFKPVSNMIPIENNELRDKKYDSTKYRQSIRSLLYLAICTRPDILFSVSKASRKVENPTYEDWLNVLRIFRYLKGKPNYGIKFISKESFNLNAYVDADLGGDKEIRKSTTGFLLTINGSPTSWYSKLQHCVSVSTAESEYYSIHECARHCMWYKNLFKELRINLGCININCDNKTVIYNSNNQTINPKSKHIGLQYHSIRELIKLNEVKLEYIKSNENLADGFTKYLNSTLIKRFREKLLSSFNDS